MNTINESHLQATAGAASKGLISLSRTTLQPGHWIYRFGDSARPELLLAGPWWIGCSPFEALQKNAERREQTLSEAARQSLAVDFTWSRLDVLHKALIQTPLSAWAGTPQTQRIRRTLPNRRWEPDREVTQLYIPGLEQPDPRNPRQKIWETAFKNVVRLFLPA